MSADDPLQVASRFGYTAVGHVTVDVLADGSRRPGGSAFYSALQAARLGLRALIVTCGVPGELERLLEPYLGEVELEAIPAASTTTLLTHGWGHGRKQRVLAWAGPLPDDIALDTEILHLAPVARELPRTWTGRAGFLGLTPQGLIRHWSAPSCALELGTPGLGVPDAASARLGVPAPQPAEVAAAVALAGRCDALVLGAGERSRCEHLIDAARAGGGVVAITDGARPNSVLLPGGEEESVEVPQLAGVRDDLGAGDVHAAAFFTALATGASPHAAAARANAAAALRMERMGPAGIAGAEALQERVRGVR
jgi:pfkB family carbohydrate kinase